MSSSNNVEGMIDLTTLAKIHSSLRMSEHPDDALLASWVKEHYLHNMNDQIKGGCQIRTQECFAQLLNAYKRVRTLTNSAQDKWPFFDRRWKSMNQATVRSIAEGEMKLKSSDTTALDPSSSSAFVPSSTLRQAFPKQSDTATHGPSVAPADQYASDRAHESLMAAVRGSAEPTHRSTPPANSSSEQNHSKEGLPSPHKRKRNEPIETTASSHDRGKLSTKTRGGKVRRSSRNEAFVGHREPKDLAANDMPLTSDNILLSPTNYQGEMALTVTVGKDRALDIPGEVGITNASHLRGTPENETIGARVTRRSRPASENEIYSLQNTLQNTIDGASSANWKSRGAHAMANWNEPATPSSNASNDDTNSAHSPAQGSLIVCLPLTKRVPSADAGPPKPATSHDDEIKKDGQDINMVLQNSNSIEYFARIRCGPEVSSSNQFIDVPLDTAALETNRKELETQLLAYAQWKKSAKTDVAFEVWSSIFMLGR